MGHHPLEEVGSPPVSPTPHSYNLAWHRSTGPVLCGSVAKGPLRVPEEALCLAAVAPLEWPGPVVVSGGEEAFLWRAVRTVL